MVVSYYVFKLSASQAKLENIYNLQKLFKCIFFLYHIKLSPMRAKLPHDLRIYIFSL